MNAAINKLESYLNVLEINKSTSRKLGRHFQADMERQEIDEVEEALRVLRMIDGKSWYRIDTPDENLEQHRLSPARNCHTRYSPDAASSFSSEKHVERLIQKASETDLGSGAIGFAQAASHAASALKTIRGLGE